MTSLATQSSRPRTLGKPGRFALITAVVAGVVVRIIALERLPGINGDEAWYGANVHLLLDGETPFLRTGVGNLLSPLHSLPLIALEWLAGPSFALLRLPSVFWGCLAVVCAYPLLAPLIGSSAAVILTGAIALSPAAVSQARLGWDPSATILVSLLTVAFVIDHRRWRSVAAFLLSLVVHPTNIFLAPIVATQWCPAIIDWYRSSTGRVRRRMLTMVSIALAVAGVVGLQAARRAAHAGFLPSIELVTERLTTAPAWYSLGAGVVSLLSGATSAAIAGPPPRYLSLGANLIVLLAIVCACIGYWRARHDVVAKRMAWLAAGFVASIISFHVVGGPRALEPGSERYAMFLVVPLTIVCAGGLGLLNRKGWAIGGVLCGALAAVLTCGYFLPLMTEGGRHGAFRTGPIEPKLAAFEFVNADSRGAEVVAVFAEDWWLYWPIRYLAWHERRLYVEMLGDTYDKWLVPPGGTERQYPRMPDRAYAIVFRGSAFWLALQNDGTTLFTAHDPADRPIIDVIRVPAGAVSLLRAHAHLRR